MKYLILFLIIILTDTAVSCTKEYIPVFGYSSEGYEQGTFEKFCLACRNKNVVYLNQNLVKLKVPTLQHLLRLQIPKIQFINVIHNWLQTELVVCSTAIFNVSRILVEKFLVMTALLVQMARVIISSVQDQEIIPVLKSIVTIVLLLNFHVHTHA